MDKFYRQAGAGVLRAFSGVVIRNAFDKVVGTAGIKCAIAALDDIDRPRFFSRFYL